MTPKTVAKFWKRKILRFFCARNEINRPSIREVTLDWNFRIFVTVLSKIVYQEFTFFDIDLESNSSFVCTPTNLYFSESPSPEVFKKYKLRLPQINLQQAFWARVMGLPDTTKPWWKYVSSDYIGPWSLFYRCKSSECFQILVCMPKNACDVQKPW